MELPYSKDGFMPIFSAEMFDYHHGKHLQAYVNNANNLIVGSGLEDLPLEEVIIKAEGGLYNNTAQIFNHEFFFNEIAPNAGGSPKGALLAEIEKTFGSFDEFKAQFTQKAATLFGSGWAWLIKNKEGHLEIKQYANADTPIKYGDTPLLTIDVWEHAYYIDYRNARPGYIEKFFDVINWDFVASKF
jgi:Fe-Mn family superoxide dismutase